MEPGVVRHADGEVDQCAGQLRDHLDGRFTTAHRAHAGAEHHTEDGADDAAGDEQHEVVDHPAAAGALYGELPRAPVPGSGAGPLSMAA
ncbi:hypothetical protein G6F32_016504 [Rhizopus arrhizus]|nr:hypothetical protein G6F32_016504 [Rhizopus arrhizus]